MKKFSKTIAITVVTAMALSLTACGGSTDTPPSNTTAEKKEVSSGSNMSASGKYDLAGIEHMTLTLTSALSLNHGCWEGFYVPFMEKVEAETNGIVKFEVYSAGELVEGGKEFDALREGIVDIAAPLTPIYDASRFPTSDVGQLPLKKSNAMIATKAYDLMLSSSVDIKDGLTYRQIEFEKNGIHFMVHNIPAGAAINTTGKKLDSIGTSSGLSMRTSSRAGQIFATSVGMTPISMAAYDLYDAMSRGAVDGALIHIADWPAYGLQEIFKYSITDASYGHFVAGCAMTEEKWNSLPEPIQNIIEDIAEECRYSGAELWDQKTVEVIADAKTKGIEFISFNDIDKDIQEKLNKAAVKTWADYIKMQEDAGVPGKKIVNLWADCVIEAGGELPDGVSELLK